MLASLLWLFGFLAAGLVLHRLKLAPAPAVVDRLARYTLYVLLASMGLRLAQSRGIAAQLPTIGALAGATALATTLGTVLMQVVVRPLWRGLERRRTPVEAADTAASANANPGVAPGPASAAGAPFALLAQLRGPFRLLMIVAVAFLAGLVLPVVPWLASGDLTSWALYALLLFIGMQLAANPIDVAALLLHPATLIVPLATAAGSLGGAWLVGRFGFGLAGGKALALGAGFGWYSLSGVLISDLGDPLLGSAAFLANMLRETIALLTIPVLCAAGRPEAAVGVGGATSMDVTLPLIERCAGPRLVPLALTHGVLLSLAVPFLVPVVFPLP